ncbi:unnamed protein product [Caenorhabditis auriculariae]|uniref:C2H2-type domain-containing protein n=1 Tax=Caenorhabditis auriculariae TaxID=2777116 RepID=A0A8S1GZM0_9PELO|nr:unnamed protein product [Caenorhabditis auriculariae]
MTEGLTSNGPYTASERRRGRGVAARQLHIWLVLVGWQPRPGIVPPYLLFVFTVVFFFGEMPYRAELKRPDLKGSFPCSVCGKIFCHSSSLSRHRMQAHFKSYTCTQCSQEISSNETLRSHMFRMHSISRMFMCRCCNWAFPDKTSLHIHMQSMLRTGTPGDVAVLARSSTEDGPCEDHSPRGSPSFSAESLLKQQIMNAANNNTALSNNNSMSSIFPNLLKAAESVPKPVLPMDLSSLAPNQWLSAWLANNPLNGNLGLNNPARSNDEPLNLSNDDVKIESEDDYDELEVHTTEEDIKDEDGGTSEVSPTSVIVKLESKKPVQKRKMTADDLDDIDVEGDDAQPPLKMMIEEKEVQLLLEQPSPTVSDTHTSGSSSHQGDVSPKCFDCQVAKGKLSASEMKLREYEKKIRVLEGKIEDFKKLNPEPLPTPSLPAFGPALMQNPAVSLSLLQNPAMKMILQNFMQAQMNRC